MTTTLNLFPATVTTPRGSHVKTRVQIADGRVRVFALVNGSIDLVEEADVSSFERARNRFSGSTLTTSAGEEWSVKRGSGCGCGNALRNFDPSTWVAA